MAAAKPIRPTGVESPFGEDELIVTKTDLKGHLTYVNDVFLRVAAFRRDEVIGQPHNIIRHPDMPRCVFKLLWDSIQAKKELFAYVVNLTKHGDHYWVLAHVTATLDGQGNVIGYHSNRRKPDPGQITRIGEIYGALAAEERRHENRKAGMQRGFAMLLEMLKGKGMDYDEFVFSI